MKQAGITLEDPKQQASKQKLNEARDTEAKGDFALAAKQLEDVEPFDESTIDDPEAVRARANYLTRLGEMRWRYRVVKEGTCAPS